MTNHEEPVTTEIAVVGADCTWCFNETLDALRVAPGVIAAHGSIAAQCFRIEHGGIDDDELLSLVRAHLHAEDISSSEHVMVEVDPKVVELHCTHGSVGDTAPEERHV